MWHCPDEHALDRDDASLSPGADIGGGERAASYAHRLVALRLRDMPVSNRFACIADVFDCCAGRPQHRDIRRCERVTGMSYGSVPAPWPYDAAPPPYRHPLHIGVGAKYFAQIRMARSTAKSLQSPHPVALLSRGNERAKRTIRQQDAFSSQSKNKQQSSLIRRHRRTNTTNAHANELHASQWTKHVFIGANLSLPTQETIMPINNATAAWVSAWWQTITMQTVVLTVQIQQNGWCGNG